jgi:hypothetical protein
LHPGQVARFSCPVTNKLSLTAILFTPSPPASSSPKGSNRSPLLSFGSIDFSSLISTGAAIPFTAYASSPTITMPRVKALTTGSIPSFLDVILNFAESDTSSTLATQDTWLAQLRASGRNLVMFGDDTWLKLFPDFFLRADGTSSFFVAVGMMGPGRGCMWLMDEGLHGGG